jgi:Fe-S-cluster containining protein
MRNVVPCNGCTACCRNEVVLLSVEHGDDPDRYVTDMLVGGPALRHKENGECVYLGEVGCTIHETVPYACRMFDCRRWLMKCPDAMVDLLLPDDVYGEVEKAAKERLP